ncbi:DUF4180 domain-containing protein [Luedemannella helvata]|uniref:DUF4180 domain-containing protein n=1 Tax=Luedemannella helvata TaxID=349315 RepID=A0ABN2KA00_9ACTN
MKIFTYPSDGPVLSTVPAVIDLIGETYGTEVEAVVIPADRLADDFFVLRTGFAGEVTQKFVNYRLRLVIVGDIAAQVARSDALRDFVTEANRGRQLWFVADEAELDRRLAG